MGDEIDPERLIEELKRLVERLKIQRRLSDDSNEKNIPTSLKD